MKRFEYKEDWYTFRGIGYTDWLNEQGDDGWEFVQEEIFPNQTKVLFKREK